MIIGIIVPNNALIPFETVKCLLSLKGYDFYMATGCSLPYNRNKLFNIAKSLGEDLLFIDTDMVFTKENVETINARILENYDVVVGNYCLGVEPHSQAIFERVAGDYKLTIPKQGLYEIDAGGTGFMAISKRVIQTLGDEPFNFVNEGEIQHGDDISFCHRVKETGFKIWCDQDIRVGHLRIKPMYSKT